MSIKRLVVNFSNRLNILQTFFIFLVEEPTFNEFNVAFWFGLQVLVLGFVIYIRWKKLYLRGQLINRRRIIYYSPNNEPPPAA